MSSDYSYDDQVKRHTSQAFSLRPYRRTRQKITVTNKQSSRSGPVLPFFHPDPHRPGHSPFDVHACAAEQRLGCAGTAHSQRLQDRTCGDGRVPKECAEEEAAEGKEGSGSRARLGDYGRHGLSDHGDTATDHQALEPLRHFGHL